MPYERLICTFISSLMKRASYIFCTDFFKYILEHDDYKGAAVFIVILFGGNNFDRTSDDEYGVRWKTRPLSQC